MIHVRLIDNFSGVVGDEILNCMALSMRMMMAVAFVKLSGIRLIEKSLLGLLDRGGKAEIVFGLDFSLTESRALSRVLEIQESHPALTVFAFSDPYLPGREPAFHPKLYIFEKADGNWAAIIGSSNLSKGGLVDNVEIGVAIEGQKVDPLIAAVLSFYQNVRGRESLFVPTDDYLEAYQDVQSTIERGQRRGVKRQVVKEAIAQLRKLEEILPGTVPTQKELIIQAIKSLRTNPDSWVHWAEIAKFVETRARVVGAEYKWDTLYNSVRGRLNEHTVGKFGDDLFERKGGVSGRLGMYRLTSQGESFVGRRIIR
ncbi:MAG: hypothetical protein FJ024_10070 [Chloroflexi bacterium]|nr:hypothetical protein [Chloroflexota bacterium]